MKGDFTKLILRIVALSVVLIVAPVLAITQGENATQGRWPSAVGLVTAGGAPQTRVFCAASLIAPRWVLTAAHCAAGLNPSRVEVITGLYALNQTAGTQRHAVSQIIVHPHYNTPAANADISLIKLATASSRPILPVFGESLDLAGHPATVTGWGVTQLGGDNSNILQQASMAIIGNTSCRTAYEGSLEILPTMLCAGDGLGGPAICTRDSGSSLTVRFRQQDVLVGVASFVARSSTECGPNGFYSGFARVSALLGFLQQHVPNLTLYTRPPGFFTPAILHLLLDD